MPNIVKIERMSYGPDAVGRLESGKAVFVPGCVPGDTVEVRIVEEKPAFARGVVAKVVEASPKRVQGWEKMAADPTLASIAPWALLSYDAQLRSKRENVRSALLRTAHMDGSIVDSVLAPIVPAKDEWGYRNKLEMAATTDAQGRFALGFHESGTEDVAIADRCPLGNRLLAKTPKALTGAIRYLCGPDAASLGIYRVGIRGSVATRSVEVALWTPPSSFPRGFAAKVLRDAVGATSVVRVIANEGSSRKVKRVEVLDGAGFWQERMVATPEGPVEFDVSAPSFFQVNTDQAASLVRLAFEALGDVGGAYVADLYSGVGTFAIPLALAGADVVAVELEGSSSRDFRRNADAAGVDIEAVCDDVVRVLPELGGLDAAVIDPPRAGIDKRVVQQLADASPERIIYISCDPQTLARDIARLAERGYLTERITPVDMFPQTYHTECVCVLHAK